MSASLTLDPALGPVLTLVASAATCRIALHGATVLSYVPSAGVSANRDLLWLSPEARAAEGKAIRGGIPLCGPWFGPHGVAKDAPVHGLLRTRSWAYAGTDDLGDGRLRASFALNLTKGLSPAWPHAAAFLYTVTVGDTLEVELSTRNTGETPFLCSGALHTYFAVSDVRTTRIEGLADREYLDYTAGCTRHRRSSGALVLGEETAHFHFSSAPVELVDPGAGRRIRIAGTGGAATVVWNPWEKTAAAMPDVGARWPEFLCIENANIPETAVPLLPACSHHLTAEFSLKDNS